MREWIYRLALPDVKLWFRSALSPDQSVEVYFQKKPSQQDLERAMEIFKLCAKNAAPQEDQSLTKPDSQESPASGSADAASFISSRSEG